MRAFFALMKREFLEHRTAFFRAPIVLLSLVSLIVIYLIASGNSDLDLPFIGGIKSSVVYEVGLAAIFFGWFSYLSLALFFYYSDAFSADRRDNALLFWKSMPQSDFKILSSKALAGLLLFSTLILGFAVLSGALFYIALLFISGQQPFIHAPGLGSAISSLAQMTVAGAAYFTLGLLWFAPALAWVAGLSTLFRRWSIPLAVLIPALVILLEFLNSLRSFTFERPISDFLTWRLSGFPEEDDALLVLTDATGEGPLGLIRLMIRDIDWTHMALGVAIATLITYLASEYRRRRIEA